MKWIWTLALHEQIESCKSHIAEINYLRVFSRSLVFGIIIAVICNIINQKTKKKLKNDCNRFYYMIKYSKNNFRRNFYGKQG